MVAKVVPFRARAAEEPVVDPIDLLQEQAFLYAADFAAVVERERRASEQLREALIAAVRALATLTETRNPGSLRHGLRVGRRAQATVERLGLDEQAATHAFLAGLLHDAGVAELLPSGVSPRAIGMARVLRQHPVKAAEMLAGVSALEPLVPFIREHHESLNGSGYPNALMGSAISLPGRIMAAAEMYEEILERVATVSSAPEADALATVERAAGTVLDRTVVRALRATVVEPNARLAAEAEHLVTGTRPDAEAPFTTNTA